MQSSLQIATQLGLLSLQRMKQTNNAIKFLMAQYRAIFKNANIAMLAAIAASALAAGQAQAVAHTDWTKVSGDTVTIDDGTSHDTLAIVGSGSKVNDNPFKLVLVSGAAATIKGDSATPDASGAGVFSAANATITLDATSGGGTAAGNAKLTIGTSTANENAHVTVSALTNKAGTLTIEGAGADVTGNNPEIKTSALTANKITIGGEDTTVQDGAVVEVKGYGSLNAIGTGSGEGLIVGKNAKISVAENGKITASNLEMTDGAIELSAANTSVTASTMNLTKGTVTLSGAAATTFFGDKDSTIVINGATIKDGASNSGTVKGKTITLKTGTLSSNNNLNIDSTGGEFVADGGSIENKTAGKSITFRGNTKLNDGVTVSNSGNLIFIGDATISDKAQLDLGAAAVTKISADANTTTSTLNVSKATFAKLVADAKKIAATTAANGQTAVLHFTDAEEIDLLETSGVGIISGDGTGFVATNVDNVTGDGVFAISASKAKLAIEEYKPKAAANSARIIADELTVGKTDAFTLTAAAAEATLLQVGKTLTVVDGTKELKVAKGAIALEGAEGSSGNEVKASKITLGDTDSGSLAVTSGEWKVQGLTITKGNATVSNNAKLTITGDLKTTTTDGKLIGENSAIIDASGVTKLTLAGEGAELKNTSTLILSKKDVFNASGDRINENYAENAVTGEANTTINIMDGKELATISREKFEKFSTASGFKGLWGVKVDGLVPESTTEMDIAGQGNNNIIAGLGTGYENVQAKVDGTKPIDNNYSAGSVVLSSGDSLAIGTGSMTLQNANAHDNDGMFVSKPGAASGDKATLAGVKFDSTSTADSSLTLQGSGKIGAITAETAGSGSVTFGAGEGKTGDVTVEGAIGTDAAAIGKLVTNGSNVTIASGDVFVQEIDFNGGSFTVAAENKLVLGDGQTFDAAKDKGLASTIDGNLTAGTLTFKTGTTGSVDIAGNAVVDLGTLTGAENIAINVGKDGVENGSATLLADKLVLKQSTLKIDPAYDQPYASAIAMDLSGASGDTLDGLVEVGHNALFAVGFDTKAEVDAVLGTLVKNGSFADPAPSEPAPGPSTRSAVTVPGAEAVVTPNAVVLNKGIKFDGNGGIYVGTKPGTSATANTLTVDAGSALVITDKVFTVDPATGKKTGAAIVANGGTGGTAAIADGAKLVLVGAFNGADNELEILNGFTTSGDSVSKFDVSIGGSDLLEAKWNGTKLDVNLTQDKAKLASAFAGASTPVKQFMLDMLAGDKFAYSTEAGYQLINELAMAGNGTAADAAAHAATYAGAQQAAVASVTTMADAMFGRVGAVGVEAASIAATGSQANGGVWLTPMYKSVDSDGFNAQGASYGSDVDLSGVAFGADTVNGNMRFGAVFNIGSGDAEGKGNGNGLKDEFDYYGFGIYSAMGFGNFALVGDASMTVISHEVEGHNLKGKADTTAVTMGVTGQYTVATPAVDVTPHLGARFIRLNTDSYDLVGEKGVVGTTDFDVQNVFSVPLGVTLSKAFVAGGWSLAPSADLTIAFNTGDTDAKSTTRFSGINKNLDLTSEVLDEVQYGLTVGLGAQYGAFGTSFGINYTGSDNTDAFGVNAQCRYMF